ncbi:MAG: dihydrolipoyl dehydrogenase [Candidatus Midichloria sp.]|nr:dihydrolipoyl dehydrogenase [Candidatus Midichloria sp.]
MEKFDVVIIGAGPGGYVAAIRAAQLGLKTAVVEKEHLGGICLNWGCIPTKALLRSAEVYHLAKHSNEFGVECQNVKFDFSKIIERSRQISKKLADGISQLMKKNKITVINGTGKLAGKMQVAIFDQEKEIKKVEAKNIILATGVRAKTLPGLEPDSDYIWTYKEAMVLQKMPKSLLVVGSGAIGIEFASFYNMLGVEVTVIEIADRILGAEDEEIAAIAHKSFEKRGIKIVTNAQIKESKKVKAGSEVIITTKQGENKSTFEKIIVAAGIVPNTEAIGLENTKIQLHKGFIKTNEYCQTDEANIYAIGDLTSPPWLAHKASHEAVIAVEKIANQNVHPLDRKNIPGCTYCYPQIASIGYTEKQAREAGFDVKIGKFPFIGNGKAIAMGETEGMVKIIYDKKTGELLGAHLIGAEVTEMVQGFAIAKTLESTEQEIIQTIFPHPTMSEMMHEATLAAFNRAIHISSNL